VAAVKCIVINKGTNKYYVRQPMLEVVSSGELAGLNRHGSLLICIHLYTIFMIYGSVR